MATPAPKTLEELAERAGIQIEELADFEEGVFMRLMEEQAVNAVAMHRLQKKFRDLKAAQRHTTAQEKFQDFFARVGGADSLAGLQHVPVATLPSALAFLRGAAGAPSDEALRAATRAAYAKADSVLSGASGPEVLTRDEAAAVNIYTQDDWLGAPPSSLFRPLNAALRSEARLNVKAYWGYIRLLQHALFKLPKDQSGTLYRGVKLDWPGAPTLSDYREEMVRKQESGEEEIWWGFSSTSTSLPAVRRFLGEHGPRVIFTVDAGSSARDVRRYSCFQHGQAVPEDERLLPCGTAFVVKTAEIVGDGLLMVGLRQTNDILIQGGAPAEPPALLEAVAPEPEGPAEPVEDQNSLEVLCAMGFSAAEAREALRACGGDSASAVEWMVARVEELEELVHARPERVVQLLGAAISCQRVQEAGVKRIRMLARDKSLRRPIAAAGGVEAVLRGMGRHLESAAVQQNGCGALWNLALDESLRRAIAAAGGVEAVLRGMGRHLESAGVQENGCGALWNLARDESLKRPIAAAGGAQAVSAATGCLHGQAYTGACELLQRLA